MLPASPMLMVNLPQLGSNKQICQNAETLGAATKHVFYHWGRAFFGRIIRCMLLVSVLPSTGLQTGTLAQFRSSSLLHRSSKKKGYPVG